MKKAIFVLVAVLSVTVLFTSCKETKKGEVKKEEVKKENVEMHNHDKGDMMAAAVYQCPMDCEKGKTYDKPGSCPVCKMDLKMKTADGKMQHADGCTCKDGGECTCEEGACKCNA